MKISGAGHAQTVRKGAIDGEFVSAISELIAGLTRAFFYQFSNRCVEFFLVADGGVKGDHVVVSQRCAAAMFVQLLGQFPVFDRYAVGLEKLDDSKLRALDRDEVTGRAPEPVLVAVIIDTTAGDYSVRIKIDIPTRFTRHSNRSHNK